MSWLVANGRVLASAEVAESRHQQMRGLLGRDCLEGAMVLPHCRWVHTVGMRFPIDVAHLDGDGVVLRMTSMPRHRVGLPVWGARTVIEASAGAFERWGLRLGDVVEVRQVNENGEPPGSSQPTPDHGRTSPSGNLRLVAEPVAVG
jgi:uncharacterized membrane protein (UPF0127 family)